MTKEEIEEMLGGMTILSKDENGRLTVSEETVSKLEEISKASTELKNLETAIRTSILDNMMENHIDKCTSCNMNFTVVMPKAKGVFDVDSFLMNENEDVVKCFTQFEEEETFDIDAFKAENPEMYKKYTKSNIIPIVDTKKLEKTLEPVFKKYYSETPSDKPCTLRITSKKGE